MKKIIRLLMLLLVVTLSFCRNEDPKQRNAQTKTVKARQEIGDTLYYKVDKNHIILNAQIEDSINVRLIYDTGAGGNLYFDSSFVIKRNWFKDQNVPVPEVTKMNLITYANERNLLSARKLLFSMGNIKDSLSLTSVANIYKVIKDKADGIIGNGFMSKYVLEINYVKKYLVLHNANTFSNDNQYDVIPFKFNSKNKLCFIDVEYSLANGKHFTRNSLIDLGVGTSHIIISDEALINKFDLQNQIQNKSIGKDATSMLGTFSIVNGNISSIKIGDRYSIDTPRVELLKGKTKNDRSGPILIGNYVFSKFGHIFIDYQNQRIYVPRLKNY